MLVVPSNLCPGTLYALFDKFVAKIQDKQQLIDREQLKSTSVVSADSRKFVVQEEIGNIVDIDAGHTYVDYELADGEEIIVSHRNKEIPLEGSMMFRAQIKRDDAGKIIGRFNIGSEPWGQFHPLSEAPEVIGIPNEDIRTKAQDQLKWGARVASIDGGKTLRIYLDRVGAGTVLRFKDGTQVMFKGRIVVKQTNITESYHLSAIIKCGFTGNKKPQANPLILKALRNSKVGCVIDRKSVV